MHEGEEHAGVGFVESELRTLAQEHHVVKGTRTQHISQHRAADRAAEPQGDALLCDACQCELGLDVSCLVELRIDEDDELGPLRHMGLDLLDDELRIRAPAHDERALAGQLKAHHRVISGPRPRHRIAVEDEYRIVLSDTDRLVAGHDDRLGFDGQGHRSVSPLQSDDRRLRAGKGKLPERGPDPALGNRDDVHLVAIEIEQLLVDGAQPRHTRDLSGDARDDRRRDHRVEPRPDNLAQRISHLLIIGLGNDGRGAPGGDELVQAEHDLDEVGPSGVVVGAEHDD